MTKQKIVFQPIGVIHSPFKAALGTPIQPAYAEGAEGTVELLPEYVAGLADLEGFERIWLLSYLDRTREYRLKVVPFRDTELRGLFSTRSPSRPNPLGLSVVKLLEVKKNILRIAGVDLLDGTPLLDIKPYVPFFEAFPDSKAGWLEKRRQDRRTDDGRFAPQ